MGTNYIRLKNKRRPTVTPELFPDLTT